MLTTGNMARLKREEIPQSSFCSLLSSKVTENSLLWWEIHSTPELPSCPSKILLLTVLSWLQPEWPLGNWDTNLTSWIMRPYFGSEWFTRLPTRWRASISHGMSPCPLHPLPREKFPKELSLWETDRQSGEGNCSSCKFQFSQIFWHLVMHCWLKDGNHDTRSWRKLLFSPNLDWFSEIHRKLEQQARRKGREKRGKSTHVGRKYLESHRQKKFTQILLNPGMHEEWSGFFLTDHQGSKAWPRESFEIRAHFICNSLGRWTLTKKLTEAILYKFFVMAIS